MVKQQHTQKNKNMKINKDQLVLLQQMIHQEQVMTGLLRTEQSQLDVTMDQMVQDVQEMNLQKHLKMMHKLTLL